MKRILLSATPVALAIAAALPLCAQAQSNVQLYGTVDAGYVYGNHAAAGNGKSASVNRITSNILGGSRWGLKGNEDLGGGLSAIFQIESGFSVADGNLGQGKRMFGRKAIIGLAGKSWGEITIGRQYDPVVGQVQGLTGDGSFGGFFATPGDVDNYDNSLRVNNALRYATPNMGGVTLEAMYAMGGVAGDSGSGSTYGFAGAYNNGPLGLGAGFLHADGGRHTGAFGERQWSGSSGSLFNTAINIGFGSAKSVEIIRAAGKYAYGPATFGASYSNTRYGSDGLSAYHGTAKFDSLSTFLSYGLTPAMTVGAGYHYTRLSGPARAHYNQFSMGATYALSMRTTTYIIGGYQRASGNTLNAFGQTVAAQASVSSYGLDASARTQLLVGMGMKHNF